MDGGMKLDLGPVTGGGQKPTLSSSKRASSAPTKERPPPPLTPRNKKASRSLFKELEGTCGTMKHARKRVEQVLMVVQGTIQEVQNSNRSAIETLANNKAMAAGTKETKGSDAAKSPSTARIRPMTFQEKIVLRRELRDQLEAEGQERDPTEDEINAEMDKRAASKIFEKDREKTRNGISNKPIVVALEALRDSTAKQVQGLLVHERVVAAQLGLVEEIIDTLEQHRYMRDCLFDPLKSTDLKFAKKMIAEGKGEPIERSVLYQKMNFVPKDAQGKAMKVDWSDKDPESGDGKRGQIVDSKGNPGLTGHEATFCAADREDQSRAVCNKAMKAVRDAQSELALRKSSLQVAVRASRELAQRQKQAARSGKFGSSEQRNTDPASRKLAGTPEDA